MTDLIRKHPVIEKATAADRLLYLGYLFFIWIDPYFTARFIFLTLTLYILMDCFNRCYISKISFVLSDILSSSIFLLYFITRNQNKNTEWELLSKLIMYTHLLLISTVQFSRAYCSFLYYNIFIVSEQVVLRFFYAFEQICSNVQLHPLTYRWGNSCYGC